MSGRKKPPAGRKGAPRVQSPPPARVTPEKEAIRRARRDAARQEREAVRRKIARRRALRRIAWTTAAVVTLSGLAFLVTRPKHSLALNGREQALIAEAPTAVVAAGCDGVHPVPEYPGGLDRAHIGNQIAAMPALSQYPSRPPASGPHNSSPVSAGVYTDPPPIDGVIHSLEHGAAVVWYAKGTSGAALKELTSFFDDPSVQDHVIVAPYDYPEQGAAGELPQGKLMTLVSWHHIEYCSQPNLAVAFDFVAHYRYPTPKGESYDGDAPEAGAAI